MIKVLFLGLSLVIPVHEPNLYDPGCCSEHDCKPVACSELEEHPDKVTYLRPSDKQTFTFGRKSQVLISRDKRCHVCISEMGTARCVYLYYKGPDA